MDIKKAQQDKFQRTQNILGMEKPAGRHEYRGRDAGQKARIELITSENDEVELNISLGKSKFLKRKLSAKVYGHAVPAKTAPL